MLSGCGPSDHPVDRLTYDGVPGSPAELHLYQDTPVVDVRLMKKRSSGAWEDGWFMVDSGSPITIVEEGMYNTSLSVERFDLFEAFGMTFFDLRLVPLDLFEPYSPLSGVIGGDILRHFTLALDYRHMTAYLFEEYDDLLPVTVPEILPSVSITFSLLGGGVMILPEGGEVTAAATRVTVTVEVEGMDVVAVVDTGASAPVLTPALAESLMERRPERPVLEGIIVDTASGLAEATMTRVARMTLGDAEATSVPCMWVHDELFMYYLSREIGQPVTMLLGGAFLRNFFLVMDYPRTVIHLAPYSDLSHIDSREYVFVGFSLIEWEGAAHVDTVYPSTDAERKGVRQGDRVVSVDGETVSTPSEAAALVDLHQTGEDVLFVLQRGSESLEIPVLLEDLLPPFVE